MRVMVLLKLPMFIWYSSCDLSALKPQINLMVLYVVSQTLRKTNSIYREMRYVAISILTQQRYKQL